MAYQPALDGLRAVSVLLVLLMHTSYGHIPGGWVGVNMFFVISGYLITALLVDEWSRSHTISVRAFYVRRALRLLPALLATIVVTGVIWWLYQIPYSFTRGALATLFYYANWVAAFKGPDLGDFGHMWSLSVEEQFYLVWPLALIGLLARFGASARLAYIFLGLAVAIAPLRALLYRVCPPLGGYTSTISRADALLLGASLAMLMRTTSFPRWAASGSARALNYCCLVVMLGCTALVGNYDPPLYLYSLLSLISLANAVTLANLAADSGSPLGRLLSTSPFVWLGRRSYGIYLYHFTLVPALEPLREHHNLFNFAWVWAARIVLSIAVAALSYHYIEQPFLRWKERLRATEPEAEPRAPACQLSSATLD